MSKVIVACLLALLLSSCAGSKVSLQTFNSQDSSSIKTIAIGPSSGVLGDAVATELGGCGYTVVDTMATQRLMARSNLDEVEIALPAGQQAFAKEGIDALLTVSAVGGYDQQPQSASARIQSTKTGELVTGVTWENGWGGRAGSIADRTMREGLTGAAKEIGGELCKGLHHA